MAVRSIRALLPVLAAHATLLCLIALSAPAASADSAMVNVDVQAGSYKSIRLKKMPKGAVIDVHIESTGSIFVALVNTKGLTGPSTPLFAGQIDRKISFTVTIPEIDDYYLFIDNRKGTEERKVSIALNATGPRQKKVIKSSA